MKRISTTLFDRASKELVDATLLCGVNRKLVDETEERWAAPRQEGKSRLEQAGGDVPEHYHWNWRRKSADLEFLAYTCFGIECQNEMQGLMLVNTNHVARLAPNKNKPLVYIDYLESAPWNLRGFVAEPRFGAVGMRLFEAALRFSLAEGFAGRVGLHALRQAEDVYESSFQMTRVERDLHYQDLQWFEMTSEQAKLFLTQGESS